MIQGFKINSIEIGDVRVEGLEVEFEINKEEMESSFSITKQIFSALKDVVPFISKIIKDGISEGEQLSKLTNEATINVLQDDLATELKETEIRMQHEKNKQELIDTLNTNEEEGKKKC